MRTKASQTKKQEMIISRQAISCVCFAGEPGMSPIQGFLALAEASICSETAKKQSTKISCSQAHWLDQHTCQTAS